MQVTALVSWEFWELCCVSKLLSTMIHNEHHQYLGGCVIFILASLGGCWMFTLNLSTSQAVYCACGTGRIMSVKKCYTDDWLLIFGCLTTATIMTLCLTTTQVARAQQSLEQLFEALPWSVLGCKSFSHRGGSNPRNSGSTEKIYWATIQFATIQFLQNMWKYVKMHQHTHRGPPNTCKEIWNGSFQPKHGKVIIIENSKQFSDLWSGAHITPLAVTENKWF